LKLKEKMKTVKKMYYENIQFKCKRSKNYEKSKIKIEK